MLIGAWVVFVFVFVFVCVPVFVFVLIFVYPKGGLRHEVDVGKKGWQVHALYKHFYSLSQLSCSV